MRTKPFVLLLVMLVAPAFAGSVDTAVVYVEDQMSCGATPRDDTECWKEAISAATPGTRMRRIVAETDRVYTVDETLNLEEQGGGGIDGNGATIVWNGPAGASLFQFDDVRQALIENLRIEAAVELHTAFEFRNRVYYDGAGQELPPKISPTQNRLRNIVVDGAGGGLLYGVRFALPSGDFKDANNDLSTISNCSFLSVQQAAIQIEHSQSLHHRLIEVSATGAASAADSAFVRFLDGNVSSFGGSRSGFTGAEFDIAHAINHKVLVVDTDCEGCARLVRTPGGFNRSPFPFHVLRGRFGLTNLPADGEFVQYLRAGTLTIDGLVTYGSLPANVSQPVLRFEPPNNPAGPTGPSSLTLVNSSFSYSGSSDSLDIRTNDAVNVVAHSNTCRGTDSTARPCDGLAAGGFSAGGIGYLALDSISLLDGHFLYCDDCHRDDATGMCAPDGDGAFAIRLDEEWVCLDGGPFVRDTMLFVADGGGSATPFYLRPNASGGYQTPAEAGVRVPALKVNGLQCDLTTAPGVGSSWSFSVLNDQLSAGVSCVIADSATSCSSDSMSGGFERGDRLAIEVESLGSPNLALVQCSATASPQ